MINQQDLSHFGASLQRVSAPIGSVYWKLIEARHADPNREFGGDQHVYIEALDENGNKLRNLHAQVVNGTRTHHPPLDKKLNEPGTNWPLFPGDRVLVSMPGGLSDQIGPLHTGMGAYKGGDWSHHTWYLVFQRTRSTDSAIPEEDTNPPKKETDDTVLVPDSDSTNGALATSVLSAIREESWRQVGVAFNRDSAFARYARERTLGAPLTNEYDAGKYRAQGFTGGIVYARIGDWANVRHVSW